MFKDYGGKINGSIYSIYRCVSGVISVIYETIKLGKGGVMTPQEQYRFERALRASISIDLKNRQKDFKNKKDMEEARKIVEQKH